MLASVDRNNVDMSWIIAVGQFEGRESWADDSEGDVSMTVTKKLRGHRSWETGQVLNGRLVNISNRWHCVGGLTPHVAIELAGQRCPLVCPR